MALDNVISVEFSSEELKKINDALATIEQVMKGNNPKESQEIERLFNAYGY